MTRCLLLGLMMFLVAGQGLAKPEKKTAVKPIEPEAFEVPIRIIVPTAKTKVWIEDKPTKQKGLERIFYSPPLFPGTYTYRVVAKWTEKKAEVTAERTIRFQAGQTQELVIEFKWQMSPKELP